MTAQKPLWLTRSWRTLRSAADSTWQGAMALTHNSMALLGLGLAFVVAVMVARPDLRAGAEQHLLGWLLQRQTPELVLAADPQAVERVTATDPLSLPREQAHVADWLSRKYRVASEPVSALVAEAYQTGKRAGIDPTVVLAVVAVESSFNPFAASPVGAQGLMQVMTRVHTDKFAGFGGTLAAFDPLTNLRVGIQVLQETLKRAGNLEGALKLYAGVVNTDGNGYVAKVMSEHDRLKRVAKGEKVGFTAYQRSADNPSSTPGAADPDSAETETVTSQPGLPVHVASRS
ncbi:MAG: hypothetical protein RJA09_1941 [Pseudomonadota bacterium]|jgi:soluble lytic murein transglycosylase-like protein